MNAEFILRAIQLKYTDAAIVPEITINDPYYQDWAEPGDGVRARTTPYRRIDALMMESFERTAIEIKVTKSDYHLDTEYKRRPWQRVVHRFIYAVPADLDVMAPHGCGLWKVHTDGTVDVAKRSIIKRHPEQLPQDVIQRLMYRASNVAREKARQTQEVLL